MNMKELNRGELLFLFDNISKDIFIKEHSWEQLVSEKLFEEEKRESITNKLLLDTVKSKTELFQELLELLTKETYLKKKLKY